MDNKCPDCGVQEGMYHEYGCDMEVCPFCGGQLFSCSCMSEKLDLPFNAEITQEIKEKWMKMLNEKGRVPWIKYPLLCRRCGRSDRELIRNRDEEWNRYIEPRYRKKFFCKECYEEIKKLIDNGAGKVDM
jgi:hypothetical protein